MITRFYLPLLSTNVKHPKFGCHVTSLCQGLRRSAVAEVKTMRVRLRQGVNVRCFNQSEHGYSVRHGVYVRFPTIQSTAIAYVTGCTYAVWPIRARRSRILISEAPCGGLRRPAVPLRRPKKRVKNLLLYYSCEMQGRKKRRNTYTCNNQDFLSGGPMETGVGTCFRI